MSLYPFIRRLNTLKLFNEKNTNKDIHDQILDTGGAFFSNLIKGFNSSVITYGLSGNKENRGYSVIQEGHFEN